MSASAWAQPAQKPAEEPPAKGAPVTPEKKAPKAEPKKADPKPKPVEKKKAAQPDDAPLLPGGDAQDAAADEKAAAEKAAAEKAAADKAAAERVAADKAAADKAAAEKVVADAAADSAASAKTTPVDKKGQKAGDGTENDTHVFAEDWWTSARPVFEVHGYYRVRTEFLATSRSAAKTPPATRCGRNRPTTATSTPTAPA